MATTACLLAALLLPAQPPPPPTAGIPPAVEVSASPAAVTLRGPGAAWSLLVDGKSADGRLTDLTRTARYRSLRPGVATVDAGGTVRAVADGTAEVEVEAAGHKRTVKVQVQGASQARAIHFENDVVPLLGRFGCNSSGCHGKAEGQNGFKLSVFGSDPGFDRDALLKESRGRRLLAVAPEHSLLLAKASGAVPHGGGARIRRGSREFETLRAWVAAGAPSGDPNAPRVTAVRVEPAERLLAMGGEQQLRVVASYSDGREADVTALARFQSNNEGLASVSASGLVTAGQVPGEAAVMAAFMGAVDVFRGVVPRPQAVANFPAERGENFVDELVNRRLRKLNILPSEQATDAEFLRRVYLDVIGTLPTPAEARRFLADRRPDRRARLVDELLERPEFADYWALKWSDLLRVDRQALGHRHAQAYHRWLRDAFARSKPLDRLAGEVLTAEGPLGENAPAAFYKAVNKPGEAASTLSQVFLGVRIACAECHHHPFDRWTQTDYSGMQAFFTQVSVRKTPSGEAVLAAGEPVTKHPRTGAAVHAHALATAEPKASPPGDRRLALAAWMTAPDNPWFARNLANRAWAHFLGRGLVEPVDDVRATNPPSNPELLDALAKHLAEGGFDFKRLVRAITSSRTYQRSARPNETNAGDELNYSRALFRRVDAEVLLDMVCQATGVPEKFGGAPPGTRAVQLWDSKVNHYFLKVFGRPVRVSACECERNVEASVAQVLHLLNSPAVQDRLSHEGGTVARLVRSTPDDAVLVEELYLTFYSRMPTDRERSAAAAHLRRDPAERREAAEDLAWGLLNSLEFVFNH